MSQALKAELRRNLRAEAARHTPAERAAASAVIRARLTEKDLWRKAKSILFYSPLADEPDIGPLIKQAVALGKVAALPRYAQVAGSYAACQVIELEHDLRPGRFGIPEPGPACAALDLKKLDLVLVPGVGFDPSGLRLGRGQGFYDRLLAEVPGLKCGVAFDWQVTVEIPAQSHDIRVDCILTATQWHEVAGRRGF